MEETKMEDYDFDVDAKIDMMLGRSSEVEYDDEE